MQGLPFVLLFTALTFLSWGAYGPLLRYGTTAMGHDGLKAFVGVGLAYFLIAVVVPFWILQNKGEKGKWTFVGTTYSIIAGSVGAIGALGIILALVFKGSPVFVMPLVFGFAPIVNTLVTAWMGGTLNKISPVFVGGVMAAAFGAGGVLYFKPPARPAAVLTQASHDSASPETTTSPTTTSNIETAKGPESTTSPETNSPKPNNASPEASAPATSPVEKTATQPSIPTKPAEATPAEVAPVKVAPIAAAPLVAAQPAAGSPPVPEQPIVAARPDEGVPPAPEKREPSVVANLPDQGQPPQPAPVKPADTPAVPKNATPDLPPPVVNPDSEPLEPQPPATTEPAKAAEPPANQPPVPEPKSSEPAEPKSEPKSEAPRADAAPAKDLPPPVPNPETDAQARLSASRTPARFVSTVEVRIMSANARNEGKATSDPSIEKGVKATEGTAHKDAAAAPPNTGMIALSILMAALCWGSYGPMLHKGQMKMGGSRLRPFACVGIAYFIIAVAVPMVLLYTTPSISHGDWNVKGLSWSVIAGGAGALGALGIILAFNAGGKPIYVMPLVFGFAPVINTFISLTEAGTWAEVETMFWVSLGVVIAGAITVLITAPKAAHGPAHAPGTAGAK